jgi:hypothetical protein
MVTEVTCCLIITFSGETISKLNFSDIKLLLL